MVCFSQNNNVILHLVQIAKDCHHTGQAQACKRITWLVGCSFVRDHAKNGRVHRKMAVDCPIVITSIHTLFQTRKDQD